MQLVNSEQAKKLKACGFPQPQPKRGQRWWRNDTYMGDEYDVIVLDSAFIKGVIRVDGEYGVDRLTIDDFKEMCYMPTVTEGVIFKMLDL